MAAVISKLQLMIQSRRPGDAMATAMGTVTLDRDMIVGKGFCRRAEEIILRHMQTWSRTRTPTFWPWPMQ